MADVPNVRFRVVRIQSNRMQVIRQRGILVTQHVLQRAPVAVGAATLAIDADGTIERPLCIIQPSQLRQHDSDESGGDAEAQTGEYHGAGIRDDDLDDLLDPQGDRVETDSVVEKARELETNFAAEHPTIERFMREVIDVLVRMGI